MSIETLLGDAGGMGRFQWVVLVAVSMGKVFCGWSVLQMTFAGIIPDFYCEKSNQVSDPDLHYDPRPRNETLNSCSIPADHNGSDTESCDAYNFTGSFGTVITDFNLVCDKAWVKPSVTSMQMAGLLVGAVISGQLGDSWGRWKTNFLFALIMAVSNIATAFSNSWEVFAFCRFLIGSGIGGTAVMVFIFSVEFMPPKWRPVVGCFPVWPIGVCCFSLSAYLLQDWRNIQLATGICGLLALPLLLFVPESLRWLTVQGRLDEAQKTIDKIARWNGKPTVPHAMKTLQKVYELEKDVRESGRRYTYLDVFKSWPSVKTTVIMSYHWFCYALLYYGISFGISSLAGSIFLNIFLLGIIDIPPTAITFFFNKSIGRKWTVAPVVTLCLACLITCMVLQLKGLGGGDSLLITGLSLAAKATAAMAWITVMTWGSELYPTVIRNLGYGICNTSCRIAGILAPFLLNFDERMAMSYSILATMLAVDLALVVLLPDTTNMVMPDSINIRKSPETSAVQIETAHSSVREKIGESNVKVPIKSAEKTALGKEFYPDVAHEQSQAGEGAAYINKAMSMEDEKGIRL